ncbi:hypothetical protein [Aeromicrobium sp. UC242_57]|uniref:hypothetical protein n=1 Tax=Aeromicrobium sp. UC242_57 TaxID=3374624 RepID=UPI00379231C2
MVSAEHRREGVASRLYEEIEAAAAHRARGVRDQRRVARLPREPRIRVGRRAGAQRQGQPDARARARRGLSTKARPTPAPSSVTGHRGRSRAAGHAS